MYKDLSYLSAPLPLDIQRLIDHGDFGRARSVIARRLADPKMPKVLKDKLSF